MRTYQITVRQNGARHTYTGQFRYGVYAVIDAHKKFGICYAKAVCVESR